MNYFFPTGRPDPWEMLAKMLAKMLGLSTQMVAGDKNHQKGKKAKKKNKKKQNETPLPVWPKVFRSGWKLGKTR